MIDNIFLDPEWKIGGKTDDEIIAEWEEEERARKEYAKMYQDAPSLERTIGGDEAEEYDTILPPISQTKGPDYFKQWKKEIAKEASKIALEKKEGFGKMIGYARLKLGVPDKKFRKMGFGDMLSYICDDFEDRSNRLSNRLKGVP